METLITRAQARKQELKYYFTGKPCLRGHVFKRTTSNGTCYKCYKERLVPDAWVKTKADYDRQRRKDGFARANHLKRLYGMTVDDYNQMLADQGGVCAICKTEDNGNRRFCVDHCHDTGKVRGLLCDPCNRGIGLLKDSVSTLESAIDYLKQHSETS